MKSQVKSAWLAGAVLGAALAATAPAHAEMSAEELAKLAQNPVGNLISVPFQNNTNFNVGPRDGTQNILNIQPVYPIEVNAGWNIITRTIIPLIWQPGFSAGQGTEFGLGDVQLSAFLSPSKATAAGIIWGAGAIVQMPTNTDARLGNKNWGLGPTAVVLRIKHGDPWVYGVLANNVWSCEQRRAWWRLQQRPDPAVRQLQLSGGFLPDQRTDHDGELEGRQRAEVDRAARRRRRQDLPPGQAAGEHAAVGVLQRGAPGRRRELADPCAGSTDVPEVAHPARMACGVQMMVQSRGSKFVDCANHPSGERAVRRCSLTQSQPGRSACSQTVHGRSVVILLIVGLDRPGEGWINVSQDAMLDLREALRKPR